MGRLARFQQSCCVFIRLVGLAARKHALIGLGIASEACVSSKGSAAEEQRFKVKPRLLQIVRKKCLRVAMTLLNS